MNYKKPNLYLVYPLLTAESACCNGDSASSGTACKMGVEASAGGCEQGIMAAADCKAGTAAGVRCTAGTGN